MIHNKNSILLIKDGEFDFKFFPRGRMTNILNYKSLN